MYKYAYIPYMGICTHAYMQHRYIGGHRDYSKETTGAFKCHQDKDNKQGEVTYSRTGHAALTGYTMPLTTHIVFSGLA